MKKENLKLHVNDHEKCGSFDVSNSLGFQSMPSGYALMLNSDRTHFYWLRYDGDDSAISHDKWSIYKGAKIDFETMVMEINNIK